MRTLLIVIAVLLLASVVQAQTDTVYFGRQQTTHTTSSTANSMYGEAWSGYQFFTDSGYTYTAKRAFMRVKNYTNDTSSIGVGIYSANASTHLPEDSVYAFIRQMSAEEQTGSDQTIEQEIDVALPVGYWYTICSGGNTNGMRRLWTNVLADTTGGASDTTGTEDDIYDPRTVSRQDADGFAATWTDNVELSNNHVIIWVLVERTVAEAPPATGAIIIVE